MKSGLDPAGRSPRLARGGRSFPSRPDEPGDRRRGEYGRLRDRDNDDEDRAEVIGPADQGKGHHSQKCSSESKAPRKRRPPPNTPDEQRLEEERTDEPPRGRVVRVAV